MEPVPSTAVGAPELIDRTLTREILRGAYPPGSKLPSVRTLAVRFGMNPSTVHRAVSRLEARGLVEAQHGRGLIVADPDVVADLGFLADWLDALIDDDPPRAVKLLDELLELRRTTVARLLVRHRDVLLPILDDLAGAAALIADRTASDAAAVDVLSARLVVERSGELLARTILNSWERVVAEQPDLVAAAYDDPARNATTAQAILDALRQGGPLLAERVEAAYAAIDQHTLEVFGDRLRNRTSGHRG